MTITLIFNHIVGDRGLGDTIRSMYAFFILSKKIKFNIHCDFTGENLDHCFKPTITGHKCNTSCKQFFDFTLNSDRIIEFVSFIKTVQNYPEEHIFHMHSNHCFDIVSYEDLIKKENRESFLKWLKLTKSLQDRINQLIPKEPYVALHIRCGDKYMNTGQCKDDDRFNPNDTKQIEDIIKGIKGKVLLFTDNEQIQQKFNQYVLQTRKPVHIGQICSKEDIIDTVSQFFIMGHSTKIIASVTSGFSYWPSILFHGRSPSKTN